MATSAWWAKFLNRLFQEVSNIEAGTLYFELKN